MKKNFAVIDASANEIKAVSAQLDKSGSYKVDGFCCLKAAGFDSGRVTDEAAATKSISAAIDKLSKETGRKIHDVYACVSSTSIAMTGSDGTLLVSKYGKTISESDVRKCVRIGSAIKIPLDTEIIHRIVRGFTIDGEGNIKNPLNLEAVKLGVKVNVVTINSSVLENMAKCISHAGFIPGGFVSSGVAASLRILGDADMEEGSALINLSDDITEVTLFYGGMLEACKVISGGVVNMTGEDGTLDGVQIGSIMDEITALPGWGNIKKAVIIGRGAYVEGLIEKLEAFLKIPIEPGVCIARPAEELPQERSAYTACLGAIDYIQRETGKIHPKYGALKEAFNRMMSLVEEYL